MAELLYIIAPVLIILHFLLPLLGVPQVLMLRIRAEEAKPCNPEDLPSDEVLATQIGSAKLEKLGFQRLCMIRSPFREKSTDEGRILQFFYHAETQSVAMLRKPMSAASKERGWDITFITYLEDAFISTFNGTAHCELPSRPTNIRADSLLSSAEDQFAQHCKTVTQHGKAPLAVTPAFILARETQELLDEVAYWLEIGLIKPAKVPGTYRFTLSSAVKVCQKMSKGAAQAFDQTKNQKKGLHTDPAQAVEKNVAAFSAYEEGSTKHQKSMLTKSIIFISSMGISAVALGLLYSWYIVPALLLTLIIHELGHYLGMLMYGYRDRQIFFIPLLGAAASGSKKNATASQELIVLLLGPLPGLFIGAAFWLTGMNFDIDYMMFYGVVSVAVNYLNLLPFMPLDGGRILDLLVMKRFPRAQFVALCVSLLIASGVGLAFSDFSLLFVAAITGITLSFKWKWVKAISELTPEIDATMNDETVLTRVFTLLSGAPYNRMIESNRIELTRQLVDHFRAKRPSILFSFFGTGAYLTIVVAPILVALLFIAVGKTEILGALNIYSDAEYMEIIKNADTQEEKRSWAIAAGDGFYFNEERLLAHTFYTLAESYSDESSPLADMIRINIGMAKTLPDDGQRAPQLFAYLEQLPDETFDDLEVLWELQFLLDPEETYSVASDAYVPFLQRMVTYGSTSGQLDEGDLADAEELLKRALEAERDENLALTTISKPVFHVPEIERASGHAHTTIVKPTRTSFEE